MAGWAGAIGGSGAVLLVPVSELVLESWVVRVSPIVIVVLLASADQPFDIIAIVDKYSFVASSFVKL